MEDLLAKAKASFKEAEMSRPPPPQKKGVFISNPRCGRKLAAAFLKDPAGLWTRNDEKFAYLQLKAGAPDTQYLRPHGRTGRSSVPRLTKSEHTSPTFPLIEKAAIFECARFDH